MSYLNFKLNCAIKEGIQTLFVGVRGGGNL